MCSAGSNDPESLPDTPVVVVAQEKGTLESVYVSEFYNAAAVFQTIEGERNLPTADKSL